MKTLISTLLLTLWIATHSVGQGVNIVHASTDWDNYYLVGTLPYSNSGNFDKLKITIFGGNWHASNLGETTYYISARDGLKINRERRGGSSSKYELLIFDNGTSYDFAIHFTDRWPAVQVRSWKLQGSGLTTNVDFPIALYDPTGKTDITATVPVNDIYFTNNNGRVAIGTSIMDHAFSVNGTIRAEEVKVETGWSDFVFEPDYNLRTLYEVESYINEHGHLPDIPSAAEVEENGVNVGEMESKLLQKIEELTLYMIELKKENEELKKEQEKNEAQSEEIEQLQMMMKALIKDKKSEL